LLCHPLGGFDPTALHLGFSLHNNWFLTAHLLSSRRSPRGLGLKLLRQSTDLRSNIGMRLFDFSLDRLIEESGDLLKRFILCWLLSARAFRRD
jgi:hypothetical protein